MKIRKLTHVRPTSTTSWDRLAKKGEGEADVEDLSKGVISIS